MAASSTVVSLTTGLSQAAPLAPEPGTIELGSP